MMQLELEIVRIKKKTNQRVNSRRANNRVNKHERVDHIIDVYRRANKISNHGKI